jgi:hypothetical protein
MTPSLTGTPSAALARRVVANLSPIAPGRNPYWLTWTDEAAEAMSSSIGGNRVLARHVERPGRRPA